MFVEHKEALEVTEAPAKTMKLSYAIRLGALKRPQCYGLLFDGRGTCALGAAFDAHGHNLNDVMDSSPRVFNLLVASLEPALRSTGGGTSELWGEIGSLNDTGSTREQIADWLEAQGY